MELIKREIEDKLKKFIERKEIIGIGGARQRGKDSKVLLNLTNTGKS